MEVMEKGNARRWHEQRQASGKEGTVEGRGNTIG